MRRGALKFGIAALFFAAVPALAQVARYDSGAVTATGVGTGGSHAVGAAVGNVFAVPVVRGPGGSGIITNFYFSDKSGTTGPLMVRIYQWNPSSSTCADGSQFSSAAVDNAQLVVPPFEITPSKLALLTGDTNSYASSLGVTWDYDNADNTGPNGNATRTSNNIYVCLQAMTTENITPANLTVMLSGPQNN